MKTVDVTPTWQAVMKIYLAALENGTDEGKEAATKEILRCAEIAQEYVDSQKNKNKVVIEVKGGIVQRIGTHHDIDIALVDWDNFSQGDEPVKKYAPDTISTDLYTLYDSSDVQENEVRDELKRLHF